MFRLILSALVALATAFPANAAVVPFPAKVKTQTIEAGGASMFVRVGGHGPAVLMLHGFGDTGDMWAPLAAALIKHHTVIAPDLRGMGLSSHPTTGYDKKSQADDIAHILDVLKIKKAALVTHDIGNMVGYALAAQYPSRITRWAIIDAPLPGIEPLWAAQLTNPKTWHFNFRGPDVERLVAGRERIFLDRFYNELSANPQRIDEATRAHYAELYARPNAMHDAFEQFAAFSQDGVDNKAFLARGKLPMPILAVGGEKSYGPAMADLMRVVATNVEGAIVPNSGHWIMEEQPDATVAILVPFINAKK